MLSAIRYPLSEIGMSRANIIALLIFGAILGYFLSFGPSTTQKFKAGVYQLLAPFLTGGSGLKKQITSVRSGLKSLDQLEHENTALQAENVARDSSSWWRTVTINRGKRDGIETDMPVVTDEGLVGKTTTISEGISI